MTLSTYSSCIAGAMPEINFYKASATAKGAASWQSLWTTAGFPAAGSTPAAYTAGSGYTPTSATTGALRYTNPTSGNSKITNLWVSGSTSGTLIIYDRLWSCSGMSGTVATAQAVTTPGAITRYTSDYPGVEAWLEVYSALGSTATTATLTYTNQSGTPSQSGTAAVVASMVVGQMIPFTLATGDTGVQQVTSVTLAATTGTTGSFGVTLLRRLAEVPIVVATKTCVDLLSLGVPTIQDNACLAFAIQATATSTGIIMGGLTYSQG